MLLLGPEPLPQPMLVPMQAFMGPMPMPQPGPMLEPELEPMLQPKLEPQPELELVLELLPKLKLKPELMPLLMPMPQLELVLVLMLVPMLQLELIVRLKPKLELIIQPMVPQLEPMPEQRQELMDQQPGQLLLEFLIIEPEQLLSHLELQQLMLVLHHLKAFDWSKSKQVILDSTLNVCFGIAIRDSIRCEISYIDLLIQSALYSTLNLQ